jgi:hypothetical protein
MLGNHRFTQFAACAAAVLALSLAACGGGAGSSNSLPSTGSSSRLKGAQVSTTLTGSISISGMIAEVYSAQELLLKSNCGYENIYMTSATSVATNGLSLKTGVYAVVIGTGSCATSVTATSMSLSSTPQTPAPLNTPTPSPTSTPNISLSGMIADVYSAQELLLKSNCGYENIYMTSATSIATSGLSLKPGVYAVVIGTGSCATSVTASSISLSSTPQTPAPIGATPAPSSTPTPPPVANVPHHIATWAMDEYWAQGESASSAQVEEYVSFAEGGYGNGKAAQDCNGSNGCSSVWYFDPNHIESSGVCPNVGNASFTSSASEDWYVHQTGYSDAAHRVQGYYTIDCSGTAVRVPVYVANGDVAGVQNYFLTYLQQYGDAWNYYLMDDTNWDVVDQMYGPGGGFCPGMPNSWCTTTQELPTNASVVSEHGALANALVHTNGAPMKIFTNGTPSVSQEVSASSNFVGAMCENCVVDEGTLRTSMYATVLTDMALADQTPGAEFVELNDGASAAGSTAQIAQRLVTTAVAWLGYSEGHTIVFPNLEDTSYSLAVWPEDMLYPAQPLESMTSGANDIAVTTNVWRREFAACYDNGIAIGACAAIVNGNSGAVTVQSGWLRQTYGHMVALSGGDTLSGGTISLTSAAFTPNVTSIPAGQAILLVP